MKTWRCNLKNLKHKEFEYLKEICHLSRSVYNKALYIARQHYFETGNYLKPEALYFRIKDWGIYSELGPNTSQNTVKNACWGMKSFIALLKSHSTKASIPHYLAKDALYPVTFCHTRTVSVTENGLFKIPVSDELKKRYPGFKMFVKIPNKLIGFKLKQVIIVPRYEGRYFEVLFVFEDNTKYPYYLENSDALGIDLGVNNFATCATSQGDSFIIDGKKIKSINQWYNKQIARLSSINSHQYHTDWTKQMHSIVRKRNQRMRYFMFKSAKYIVQYCVQHSIWHIVVGYSEGFQQSPRLGKVVNQLFTVLPFGQFRNRIQELCKIEGIFYHEQEESYTSKANFWGKDEIPVKDYQLSDSTKFTGHRVSRGSYRTDNGLILNADVNAALNILRKSKVVSFDTLYNRGAVRTPMRIRLS